VELAGADAIVDDHRAGPGPVGGRDGPVKFIILCYPRTGSTLLITALGAHPEITQGMHIFSPEQEGDDPWVHWRRAALATLYGPRESYLDARGKLDGDRFDLSLLSREFFKVFDGTKIMYDDLDRHSTVWSHLLSLPDLRVIVLGRNPVEAAVSFRIAMETNVWFVPNEHSDIWYTPQPRAEPPSPSLIYPLWYFDWFYDYYCSAEGYFLELFKDHALLRLDYRDVISRWGQAIRGVQEHLGVEPIEIPMMFDKRTHGALEDLIANYAEIRAHYAAHPVLARHFSAVSSSGR
jgi:LPS sulfotransferase NodH